MTDAEAYARYWSGLTGKAPSEIYIPLNLREADPWVTPEAETPEPSAT